MMKARPPLPTIPMQPTKATRVPKEVEQQQARPDRAARMQEKTNRKAARDAQKATRKAELGARLGTMPGMNKLVGKSPALGMSKGGMSKGYAKGGIVKANCGASMKPTQKGKK